MGTDRKGPLAAFVVIAIVAAILLVTSVRSQARPQWFDRGPVAPVTVVAAPPIGDPLRWAPVTPVGQVVEDGVVLTRKAVPDPTSAEDLSTVLVAATTYDGSVPATTTSGTRSTHTVTASHHAVHHTVHPAHHSAHHRAHHRSHHSSHPLVQSPVDTVTSTATQVQATQAVATSPPTSSPMASPTSSPSRHGRHLGRSHASAGSAGLAHGRHLGWWRHR